MRKFLGLIGWLEYTAGAVLIGFFSRGLEKLALKDITLEPVLLIAIGLVCCLAGFITIGIHVAVNEK